MDPISLAIGGGLLAFGYITGRIHRRKTKPETPRAICSCKDAFSFHDPQTGRCHAVDGWGDTCKCRHYDGPQPIEQYLATPTLPPRDGS